MYSCDGKTEFSAAIQHSSL